MHLASIRLGFLLATLVASLHVAAAPRFWTLTGVRFHSGPDITVAGGYFSYDDATQTISSWNVHVDPSGFLPAFTYVPGNSSMQASQSAGAVAPTLVFSAATGVPGKNLEMRQLQLTPLAALDGSNATVPLDTLSSREYFPSLVPPRGRPIVAGSLALTAVPPPVVTVQVDEFYHSGLRHYFMTADAAEKQALDTGVYSDWVRSGESFKAYAKGSNPDGSIKPVCRFYSEPFVETEQGVVPSGGVDSHFFTADADECTSVFAYCCGYWVLENDNAFQIDLPDEATGACPGGTIPVYRLWNQRTDSNHRYTTSAAIKAEMLAEGYVAEGYGADGVVMCAVQ
jgi:hypothetical protein